MNKRGQSIIEYALIAVLVILGIVFMGSYVLRSVNAHFKLWDEGVQDSFQENITQAPPNAIPPIDINCQCSPFNASCGSTQAGSFCPANDREVDYNCNVPGCNGAQGNAYCNPDPSCCSTAVDKGCGDAAINSNGSIPSGSQVTCEPGTPTGATCYCPPGSTSSSANCPTGTAEGVTCCSTPTTTPSSPCYYGQRIWGYACGSTNPDVCITDPSCPKPACQGFSLFQNSYAFCATGTSTPPTTGMTVNTPVTYVDEPDHSDCGSTAGCTYCSATYTPPCQAYCVAPYTLNSTGTECLLQFYVAALTCDSKTNTTKVYCTSSGSPVVTTVNDESFSFHAAPSTVITSVNITPYGPTVNASPGPTEGSTMPEINGGCGNPGEPSQDCVVKVNN